MLNAARRVSRLSDLPSLPAVSYTHLLVVNPPAPHTRMTPNGSNWKALTWSWAYSTGHPASDQKLEAAARAAWSYAFLCAWTYLNDHDAAVDLMDHAVTNASQYLARHSDTPEQKLTVRIKSVIRRRARQLAAKRRCV